MNPFISYNHKGFTLIETLFAVLIFSASLVSLMIIAGRGIAAANTAREQTVAHYLAQEGLEVVRNTRDMDMAAGDWTARITACTTSNPCQIRYNTGTASMPELDVCTVNAPEGCVINESADAFVDSGTPSAYSRKIYLIPQGTPDSLGAYHEYQVVSKVSWVSKTINRTVILETILKKW